MVRAFQWAVFGDVVGDCWPPAERRGGGRAARSPERARHERLRIRLANGIRTTLENGALYGRRTGGVGPKWRGAKPTDNVAWRYPDRFRGRSKPVTCRKGEETRSTLRAQVDFRPALDPKPTSRAS